LQCLIHFKACEWHAGSFGIGYGRHRTTVFFVDDEIFCESTIHFVGDNAIDPIAFCELRDVETGFFDDTSEFSTENVGEFEAEFGLESAFGDFAVELVEADSTDGDEDVVWGEFGEFLGEDFDGFAGVCGVFGETD